MKNVNWYIILLVFLSTPPEDSFSQFQPFLDYLGLKNKAITSIGIYGNILTVGTLKHGVYWKDVSSSTSGDTSWNFIGLDSAEIYAVYPHKSGPLGWAIGAGIKPDSAYPHFVYCSFEGGPFEPRDEGISDSVASYIQELDGFPDPSVCGETYAAAGGALYRRNFTDSSWTPIYTATPEGYVQTVKVREEYPGVVVTGGAEGFTGRLLLKSFDYGNSWEWLSPPGLVTDVDFNGDSANYLWVVSDNVYESSNGGNSWIEIFNSSGLTINEILFEGEFSYLFVAGSDTSDQRNAVLFYGSVFRWSTVELDIADPIIDIEVAWDGNMKWMYLATPDSGIYRFWLFEVGIDSLIHKIKPETLHLFRNYPNPFNPSTVISWQLTISSEVELKIFNPLGQEVRTLLEGWQEAGFHSVVWDGLNNEGNPVSSGIYFCRLRSGDLSKVNKVILSR